MKTVKPKQMINTNFETGLEVVRTKGDYVVGRTGSIIAIDQENKRAQVKWAGETTTWVAFDSLAPTSIPYEIIKLEVKRRGRRAGAGSKIVARYVRL